MGKRGPYKKEPMTVRFERKVDRSGGPDACHPWLGSKHWRGHGYFNVGDHKIEYAHRVALALYLGRHVEGHALHKPLVCHNPSCCNGAHLYEGDDAQNTRDRQTDGTMPKGETHWNGKLTERDIPIIRALRHWSGFKLREIAAEYGITDGAVANIANRKTWAHVESSA